MDATTRSGDAGGPNPATAMRTPPAGWWAQVRALVGSGDRIMLTTLPFVVLAVLLYVVAPERTRVDGTWLPLRAVAVIGLIVGAAAWAWSVVLILVKVPRGQLITSGPFAIVKDPLYTAVGLLVLPFAGVLLDTWLGALIGIPLYLAARRFVSAEEAHLAATFGAEWEAYRTRVVLSWL